jgi:hypothetical protein
MDHGEDDEEKPYKIDKVRENVVRKYGVEEYAFRVKFNEEMSGTRFEDVNTEVHAMFEDVLYQVGVEYDPDDKVRLSIEHDGLERPMTIHLQPRADLTAENIMAR